MKILITGGAGFIGSHLTKKLIDIGHEVRILDNFSPQIHSQPPKLEEYKSKGVDLIIGDIRTKSIVESVVDGIDILIHLASETGTGQSMYEIVKYFDTNVNGTALLCDVILKSDGAKKIKKIINASSRSIYGEGKYHCSNCGSVYPPKRDVCKLKKGVFNPNCPLCSESIVPVQTDEDSQKSPGSIYALTKRVQEDLFHCFSEISDIPVINLRLQNVYGPGQSLSNPYTGLLAVFTNHCRLSESLNVFEDGLESRDFVYVDDVAKAFVKACDLTLNRGVTNINIGSGVPVTVLKVAQTINSYFNNASKINISKSFRVGDIRHNFAETTMALNLLGFLPETKFEDGVYKFLNWATQQPQISNQAYINSIAELKNFNLYK